MSDSMSESNFAELFEESKKQRYLKEGSDLLVQILDISENFVTVGAALKSNARIPIEEFQGSNQTCEVEVGDMTEVEIDLLDNGIGETVLSRYNARRKSVWKNIENAMNNDGVVEGVVQGRVRGGYSVDLDGLRAFLPGSLADVFPSTELDAILVGKKHEFKPIKINRHRNSVVLSRRAVIEKEMVNEGGALIENYEEGQRVKGRVRAIVDYGAFIDIDKGIYGLLHITDMLWKHTKSVGDLISIDQEVEVVVLKIDRERNRISLGMKQLQPDPWEYFERSHPVGTRIFGKVTRILDYGVFVEIDEQLQGLVHTSEMSWSRRNQHPSKLVSVGEEIEVMILEVDKERHRISLGMRQCKNNPWKDFATAYRKGVQINCVIQTINEYGLFVELPGEIEGLIRLSDISYDKKGEEAANLYRKGQEIKAVLLTIDAEKQRISLGIKQINDEHFDSFVAENMKWSVQRAKVVGFEEKGGLLEILPDGVRGFLPISEISAERVDNIKDHLKVDEELEVTLIDIDHRNKRAILSLKAQNTRKEKTDWVAPPSSDQPATTQLGALLKAQDLISGEDAQAEQATAQPAEPAAETTAEPAAEQPATDQPAAEPATDQPSEKQ